MMQDIHKKPFKKKEKIIYITLGIVFLALLIALLLINSIFPEKALPPPKPLATPEILENTPLHSVKNIEFSPLNKQSYTLFFDNKKEQFQWDKDLSYPINQTLAYDLFETALYVDYDSHITTKNIEELSHYGIDTKSGHFSITLLNGSKSTWYIGNELKGDIRKFYIWHKNTHKLYITEINFDNILYTSIENLHTVPSVNFNTDLINSISVNELIKIERTGDIWYLVYPYSYPVNQAAVLSHIDKIKKLRLGSFVANATKENLKKYGFLNSTKKIELEIVKSNLTLENSTIASEIPPHKEVFIFGRELDNKLGWYCLYEENIYFASAFSFAWIMNLSHKNIESKNILNVPAYQLTHLQISGKNFDTGFDISLVEKISKNNQIILDSQGNVVFEFYVKNDGQLIDSAAFLDLYQTLLHVEAVFEQNAPSPDNAPTYLLNIESTQEKREIAIYEIDSFTYLTKINGVGNYCFDKPYIDSIVLKFLNLPEKQ